MKPWTQLALLVGAAAALLALNVAYSRRLGDEWLARLEVEQLEQIPVLDEV